MNATENKNENEPEDQKVDANTLKLNEKQHNIVLTLKHNITTRCNFDENFLLLGPAGSGKSTVIVNAFNDPVNYRIAFCAFTNKASQVLKDITKKFPSAQNFLNIATFSTIHSFLRLKPKYLPKESETSKNRKLPYEKKTIEFELRFILNKKDLEHLLDYKIIIFDECSTISQEVFGFINEAVTYMRDFYQHNIYVIYLGDYWQLPPVGEDLSIVFKRALSEKWPVGKLTEVERAQNYLMREINKGLLRWVDIFTNFKLEKNMNELQTFYDDYPFNLLPKTLDAHVNYAADCTKLYYDNVYGKTNNVNEINKVNEISVAHETNKVNEVNEISEDNTKKLSMIITYSINNCKTLNEEIQNMVDFANDRAPTYGKRFNVGDRCAIDTPIDLCEIVVGADGCARLGKELARCLYNGESYEVIEEQTTKVKTFINDPIVYKIPATFECQILTVSRPNEQVREKFIYIKKETIFDARKKLYAILKKKDYEDTITSFLKYYPIVDRGYAMTIYKAQGSEWNYVFVNFNSIKYSLLWDHKENRLKRPDEITMNDLKKLFRTSYTVLTRARIEVKGFMSY